MILSAENLSFSYGDRVLFKNINFNVEDGDKIGVIGVNGTGKSTFLKMIANRDDGGGKLTIPGTVVMEYLPQDPPFEPQATVLEQIFKGDSPLMVLLRRYETAVEEAVAHPDDVKLQKNLLDLQQEMDNKYAWQLESEAKAVLNQLGITNLGQKMEELSGGQRKRVALAGVLVRPSDLLILDEPTNHMDNSTVAWLEQQLLKLKVICMWVTTACSWKNVRSVALRRLLLPKSYAIFIVVSWRGLAVGQKHVVPRRRIAWNASPKLRQRLKTYRWKLIWRCPPLAVAWVKLPSS